MAYLPSLTFGSENMLRPFLTKKLLVNLLPTVSLLFFGVAYCELTIKLITYKSVALIVCFANKQFASVARAMDR